MYIIETDCGCVICTRSKRAIPASNIDLHFAHCSRNLEKCKICGDMVPRRHANEHFLNTHAPVCRFLLLLPLFSANVCILHPQASHYTNWMDNCVAWVLLLIVYFTGVELLIVVLDG